jgi:hypothetical protein
MIKTIAFIFVGPTRYDPSYVYTTADTIFAYGVVAFLVLLVLVLLIAFFRM